MKVNEVMEKTNFKLIEKIDLKLKEVIFTFSGNVQENNAQLATFA
jgi:hypothetical protein